MRTRDRVLSALSDGEEWTASKMGRWLDFSRPACFDMLERLVEAGQAHVCDSRATGHHRTMTKFYRIGPKPEIVPAIIEAGKQMEPFEWLCSTLSNLSVAQ